jgi:hypothetical protein
MNIPHLIDRYASQAIHIGIDREGNFELHAEPDNCPPVERDWELLAAHQEKLIPWLVEAELHRLRHPYGVLLNTAERPF